MPRYLVQRTFPNGLHFPTDANGREAVAGIYDAPSPEAIRAAAGETKLPVDEIHRVGVLDPFFYTSP